MTYVLSVSVSPSGGGTVVLIPSGTNYASGTVVTLTAVPAPGYAFDHWGGDMSGTGLTVMVTMNANKSVVSNFRKIAP
jgi:hypothetical protein